jgi:hypothetical protein
MFDPPTILSSDPLATLAAAARHRRLLPQPTVAELVTLATIGTPFFGEITASCEPMALAAEYADIGAERWEDTREHLELGGGVDPDLIDEARVVLVGLVGAALARAEADALDDAAEALAARLDAEDAGDADPGANRYGVDCAYT